MSEPDVTGAEVYTERGPSIALGTWHIVTTGDVPTVYFVPTATGLPRPAIITATMLRDPARFTRTTTEASPG